MKRTFHYVESVGNVRCELADGSAVTLPVVPGILKHPTVEELWELLKKEPVARKYTVLALRKAPWQVVRSSRGTGWRRSSPMRTSGLAAWRLCAS